MEYEVVELQEKKIAGLMARTRNDAPDMQQVIGGLWETFYGEGVYEAVPGKTDGKALGIYTGYDASGNYDVVVGCETNSGSGVPVNVALMTIPAGKYARFIVKGNVVTDVARFWQQLWEMDLPRAFTCDFEEYQDADMEHGEIHMYISLKTE